MTTRRAWGARLASCCVHARGVIRSWSPARSSVGTGGKGALDVNGTTGVGGLCSHVTATLLPAAVARSWGNSAASDCAATAAVVASARAARNSPADSGRCGPSRSRAVIASGASDCP
jgi:hypothetical protein